MKRNFVAAAIGRLGQAWRSTCSSLSAELFYTKVLYRTIKSTPSPEASILDRFNNSSDVNKNDWKTLKEEDFDPNWSWE